MALVLVLLLTMSTVPTLVYGDNEANAVYGSTPNIDGTIDPGEWDDAHNYFGQAYVKQDGVNLYFAFDIPDQTYSENDRFEIYIDINNDKNPAEMSDDINIGFYRSTGGNDTAYEYRIEEYRGWRVSSISGWVGSISYTVVGWQLEFSISYSKVNVVAGAPKTMGLAMVAYDSYEGEYYMWPLSDVSYIEFIYDPSLWGSLHSTPHNWVPEFPSFLILPLVMIVTLVAVIVSRTIQYRVG